MSTELPLSEKRMTQFAAGIELLYREMDTRVANAISRQQREANGYHNMVLTYGEIGMTDFAAYLFKLRKYGALTAEGGDFYDLGSGCGRCCFVAALIHEFDLCCGIEILPGLHDLSCMALERYNEVLQPALEDERRRAKVKFVCDDFLSVDWSSGDIVFANSTCFSDGLMLGIAKQAELLKPGAIFITVSMPLPSPAFEIIDQTILRASWGTANSFVQRRKNVV